MAEEFKIGDVVILKSGGPSMTVAQAKDNDSDDSTVVCVWFDKTEQKRGAFPSAAIKLYT